MSLPLLLFCHYFHAKQLRNIGFLEKRTDCRMGFNLRSLALEATRLLGGCGDHISFTWLANTSQTYLLNQPNVKAEKNNESPTSKRRNQFFYWGPLQENFKMQILQKYDESLNDEAFVIWQKGLCIESTINKFLDNCHCTLLDSLFGSVKKEQMAF